jgi:hypothetical protein
MFNSRFTKRLATYHKTRSTTGDRNKSERISSEDQVKLYLTRLVTTMPHNHSLFVEVRAPKVKNTSPLRLSLQRSGRNYFNHIVGTTRIKGSNQIVGHHKTTDSDTTPIPQKQRKLRIAWTTPNAQKTVTRSPNQTQTTILSSPTIHDDRAQPLLQ